MKPFVALVALAFSGVAMAQTGPRRANSGCGIDQSCAAVSYEATRTDGGPAFTATAVGCFAHAGPGVNNYICTNETNGGEIIFGASAANPSAIVRASQYFCGSITITNGAINTDGSVIRNNTGGQGGTVHVEDPQGLMINSTTPIKGVLLIPVTIDISTIAASSCDDVTATVAGVEADDFVSVTPNFNMIASDVSVSNARVTNAGTDEVTFRACNHDSLSGQDPASGSYLFLVVRK